jgi:CRP/FNR family transcriptional regulator
VLVAGIVRVFKVSEAGREITLYHVHGGQTCLANMLCTFLDMPSPASAVVEEPVDALIMPAASLRQWVQDRDVMRTFIFRAMANRFMDVTMLVDQIAFRKLDSRLAEYLLQSFVKQRFHIREITVTLEDIAAELGSAREVISRLLKEFERLEAIDLDNDGDGDQNDFASLQRCLTGLDILGDPSCAD